MISFFVLNPGWAEVAVAALNVLQVVLLAWIARGVSEATTDRRERGAREDRYRRADDGPR